MVIRKRAFKKNKPGPGLNKFWKNVYFVLQLWKTCHPKVHHQLEVHVRVQARSWGGKSECMNRRRKLYSGSKHMPLSSQRPFHFHCLIGSLFCSDPTNTIQVYKAVHGSCTQRSLGNLFLVKICKVYDDWNADQRRWLKRCQLIRYIIDEGFIVAHK